MKLKRDVMLALVGEASRAPSVHNIQPARWRFADDGAIELWWDTRCALPIADPRHADVMLSLGAAWEGMVLALGRRGLQLQHPVIDPDGSGVLRRIASAAVGPGTMVDPLADAVGHRSTWRGRFEARETGDRERLRSLFKDAADVYVLGEDADIVALAETYDACSWEFMQRPEYHEELFEWLRLDPDHPAWSRDGLNGGAMALSTIERVVAGWLLRPGVFSFLGRCRLARPLISERAQITSATAIVVLVAASAVDAFVCGRRFYRLWLELVDAGFAACPLSALTDSEHGQAELRRHCCLARDARFVGAWRVGRAPQGLPALTPRLPVEELLHD